MDVLQPPNRIEKRKRKNTFPSETQPISDHRVTVLPVSKLQCAKNADLRQTHPAETSIILIIIIETYSLAATLFGSHFASEIPVENASSANLSTEYGISYALIVTLEYRYLANRALTSIS